MINKKPLCNTCLTGKKSLEHDAYSQMCPYVSCIKNGKCPMYKRIRKKIRLTDFFKRR